MRGVEQTRDVAAPSPHRIPLESSLLLVFVNMLWAGSSLMGKNALTVLGPSTLAFLRFGPSALLLFLVARARGEVFRVERRDWGGFLVLGGLGIAVTYGVYYNGLAETTATESTLLMASEPILIALAARIMLGEQLRRIQVLGLGIGFLGVYLIIAQGVVFQLSTGVMANLLVLVALACECVASVVGKGLTGRYSWLVVLTVEFALGSAILLPHAAWEVLRHPPGPLAWTIWANVAYVGLLCSFYCYAVWYRMLPRYPISAMAGFLFIQPMMGPVLAYIFRDERMAPWTVAGAILVVVGVWLVAVLRTRDA